MKLLLENLPPSLRDRRDVLARCLTAMDAALPIQQVILFGSHARGDVRPDSDVDLCLVAEGAARQFDAARQWLTAMSPLRPFIAFDLVPISPQRLAEKRRAAIFSSARSFRKEFPLPRKTDSDNRAGRLKVTQP